MTPLVTLCCAHLVIIETCKTKHWQQSYKYNLKHMITKKQTNRSTYQKIKITEVLLQFFHIFVG